MENSCCSVLDALSEAIARYDQRSLKFMFINRGFEQQLGQAMVLGRTVAEAFETSTDTILWQQALEQVRATGAPVFFPLYLAASGRQFQVEVLPEFAADGSLLSLLSVARDTTAHQLDQHELVESRQRMAQQHEELTRVNGHLENFVYTVAHDLRSPVDNLSVLTNLLLEQTHDDDSQLLLEHMQISVKQLASTIADLVEVLEVQSTYKVVTHRLTLSEVFEEVAAELTAQHGMEATVEVDFTALPEITYIRSYLLSIFRNLLGNAFKYRSGERPLVTAVKAWPEEGFAVLAFQDNGIGIDLPNHGHKLFMPFSRLTTQADGKGIGLHLVRNIVQKNGGRIQVESIPGVGTTFTCFLKEYQE